MCGLFGMVGDRWSNDFASALDTLERRGPDDRGQWHEGDVHLGHRRLSIIDLSAAGHQPMLSSDGRYVIAYNGEIYNHQTLRDRLESAGIRFRGHSDTEVLVEALGLWGPESVLEELDGIFAFCLWDRHERSMVLARDRFGIKPLYFSTVGGLVISSTLAPFWQLQGFPRRLHYPGLRDYLAAQSVFAPESILADVQALLPGHWARWSSARPVVEPVSYWSLPKPDPANAVGDMVELTDRVDASLCESVRRQMISDVPIGAFLSGGIDSSLMVAYMTEAMHVPVRTFSVRFPDAGDYDESRYARMVADTFGSEHVEFDANALGPDALPAAVAALDQPLADPALLPTLALSQLTREHVTVAVSGDGGDELFGGYGRFLDTASCYPDSLFKALGRSLTGMGVLPASLYRRTLAGRDHVFWNRVRLGPYPSRNRKALGSVIQWEYLGLLHGEDTLSRWLDLCAQVEPMMGSDSLMYADLWTYLQDNCLVKTDRAGMHHSLEVRVPMLGNPVVDLVGGWPASVKMAGGELKAILKRLADRRLPRAVWDRPKHGFSVPLKAYMRGSWRPLIDQWLDAMETAAPFLDHQAVRRRWQMMRSSGRGDARVMYTLALLVGWLLSHPVDC